MLYRAALVLCLTGTCAPLVSAQGPEPDAAVQPIVGSTARTTQQGYSHEEMLSHLGSIDHKRWDVKADDMPRHNTYQWDFVMPDGDFFQSRS